MKHGQVSESGTYKELLDKKGDLADFLLLHTQEQNEYVAEDIGNINVALVIVSFSSKSTKTNVLRN